MLHVAGLGEAVGDDGKNVGEADDEGETVGEATEEDDLHGLEIIHRGTAEKKCTSTHATHLVCLVTKAARTPTKKPIKMPLKGAVRKDISAMK